MCVPGLRVTDLRKSIDGLAAMVQYSFALDPFANAWFVFCNRHHNQLKILRWDTNGFWLYYRRLERGRFRWPATPEGTPRAVTRRQLQWLLDGFDVGAIPGASCRAGQHGRIKKPQNNSITNDISIDL